MQVGTTKTYHHFSLSSHSHTWVLYHLDVQLWKMLQTFTMGCTLLIMSRLQLIRSHILVFLSKLKDIVWNHDTHGSFCLQLVHIVNQVSHGVANLYFPDSFVLCKFLLSIAIYNFSKKNLLGVESKGFCISKYWSFQFKIIMIVISGHPSWSSHLKVTFMIFIKFSLIDPCNVFGTL